MVILKRRGVPGTKGQGGVVVGISVSHHHCNSAWQRTERQRAYGDTGTIENDWATAGVRGCRDDGAGLGDGGCMGIQA